MVAESSSYSDYVTTTLYSTTSVIREQLVQQQQQIAQQHLHTGRHLFFLRFVLKFQLCMLLECVFRRYGR